MITPTNPNSASANPLDLNDRLLLFGYGIFETLRVNGDQIEIPQLHYERMLKGAQMLDLTLPEYPLWLSGIEEIVKKENRQESYALRVTLSGGVGGGVTQLLYHLRSISYTEKDYQEGVKIYILSRPRNEHSPCVRIKSANYLENLLAKKEAEKQGAREGIWLNTQGHLAEGTMSNLFFVKNGVLHTPALSCGCLPGTRRRIVLECARKLHIPIKEGEFSREHLDDAEEVFLTNALMRILPVSRIGDQILPWSGSHPNSLTLLLKEAYDQAIVRNPY